MSSRVAEGRLQTLQIYRLLQLVHEVDKAQIEKMVQFGVEDLINLTEPKDGVGVLHVAVSANSLGNLCLWADCGRLVPLQKSDTFVWKSAMFVQLKYCGYLQYRLFHLVFASFKTPCLHAAFLAKENMSTEICGSM